MRYRLNALLEEISKFYLSDERPWVVGFSGGKDSTFVLQLIYTMLLQLPHQKRCKPVHVLSSDTLVETPIVIKRQKEMCRMISESALSDDIPLYLNLLRPDINETFWVNLIGKGYPSPNKWFRWCTDRLKIQPMSKFILEKIKDDGEIILVLGARKSESVSRSNTLSKFEIDNTKLRKHTSIPGALIYTPIEDYSEQEVWDYLMSNPSPWGADNQELKNLYGKKDDEEISFIVDEVAPPSGHSRFGCWTCTVVDKDRAIQSLIEDGHYEYERLKEFRNKLKQIRDDPSRREPYRKNQKKSKFIADMLGKELPRSEHRGHKVMGPFTLQTRHELLRELLEIQSDLNKNREDKIELISPEEIRTIEMVWIYEGDAITSIKDVLEETENDKGIIGLLNRLLIVEHDMSSSSRRTGIYSRLEKVLEEHLMKEMTQR